ncbi:VWA domain-containing protein [Solimicrobium silvestre]|uniref:von Willebrand factor type A domain n=1 Tax=Solimicrobium silvestre TaxID=2099400 RepID=A0A2S9GSZ3_9BURK|nr:VWA domain-containing protein [Solimicrobium silvestre]PRC90833.1 von Willebrand factor type A domain [Solimicrobium silvestre]
MFTIEGFYNPYLAASQTRLDAVLTITSDATVSQTTSGRKVVGFVLDTSGSMNGEKLAQAKLAARRGIDMLTEDIWFFVIKFAGSADIVVEACPATSTNKALAHYAVQQLTATGSTAMSSGLKKALGEVKRSGATIASVYFQTDGDNSADDNERYLAGVIAECEGVFQCDCRGIGTDWKPNELRRISSALLGTADAITDPTGLEEDFRSFLNRSLAKGIAAATLRIWSPKVVKVSLVKQMSPEILDLMPSAKRIDDKTLEIPLGAWATEARDYQLAFELPVGNIGDEVLACRAAVVFQDSNGEVKIPCEPIAVRWSEDDALTTRISREVAHYTGQKELADSIQEGLDAKAKGDDDRATRLLGHAAKLAAESGNEEVTRRLKKVVDVVDASAGTVRLKKADKGADMELEMGLTRTVRRNPKQQQAVETQN